MIRRYVNSVELFLKISRECSERTWEREREREKKNSRRTTRFPLYALHAVAEIFSSFAIKFQKPPVIRNLPNEARSTKPRSTRKAQLPGGSSGKNANLFLRPSVYFARSRVIAQRPQPTGFSCGRCNSRSLNPTNYSSFPSLSSLACVCLSASRQ